MNRVHRGCMGSWAAGFAAFCKVEPRKYAANHTRETYEG
jgi:hypothetical protein